MNQIAHSAIEHLINKYDPEAKKLAGKKPMKAEQQPKPTEQPQRRNA